MATNSETGHAKNVANFEQLVIKCTSYNSMFNPANPAIQISSLNELLIRGKACVSEIHGLQANVSRALSARKLVFLPFSKLITRISNAIKASATSQQTDDQVMSLIRKLQGRRATPKKSEEEKKALAASGEKVVEISSAQMSIDGRLANFDKLIKLLMSIPEYAPNESELTISNLTAYYEDLLAKNLAVVNASTALKNSLAIRNEMLYCDTIGMVDVANSAKLYIKSVFGATSPQYKQVSSLKFTGYKAYSKSAIPLVVTVT